MSRALLVYLEPLSPVCLLFRLSVSVFMKAPTTHLSIPLPTPDLSQAKEGTRMKHLSERPIGKIEV